MTHGHDHGPVSEPGDDIEAEVTSREHWDARYRTKSSLWSGKPNPTLVSEVTSLKPGKALEIGAGEGADAIWLARQGWTVTSVDISAVALERAAAHAAEAGADIAERTSWLCEDVLEWQPPVGVYDLVTAHYLHLGPARRRLVYGKLAAAVGAGGTLLVVAHHPSDLQTTVPRPPYPELFFTGDDLAADIGAGGWEIVTNAAAPREAKDPDGNVVTIHDTVFRARRA
jgi:SAM-dependent methyltransferase